MKIICLLLLLITQFFSNCQPFLESPIQGNQGTDWIIVNYLDWEIIGFKDHHCGSKSYDGHQGTDFVLPSFMTMDDSIAVFAAADGIITYVIDSLFDRETSGDTSKHLGNYIAISHPNNYQTYYAHLLKNSAQFQVGDNVQSGEIIGYVGSSGNSTDPHLHFELWYDSSFVVDPFSGICGNSGSLFISPPAYDTSLTIWETGLHLKNNLSINDLRERITTISTPYVIAPSSGFALYFWTQMYGLRAGNTVEIQWYTPNNVLWYSYTAVLDRDYWYYYFWNSINHTNLAVGNWTVKFFYDNSEIASESFKVDGELSVIDNDSTQSFCNQFEKYPLNKIINNKDFQVQIFNAHGQIILKENLEQLPVGIYFIKISNAQGSCVLKRWIK